MRVRDRSIHSSQEKGGVDQVDQDQWWSICVQCVREGMTLAPYRFFLFIC